MFKDMRCYSFNESLFHYHAWPSLIINCRRWEEDDNICRQWQAGQPWGNCNMALVISARARLVRCRLGPGPLVSWADQECGLWSEECGVVHRPVMCQPPDTDNTHWQGADTSAECTSQSIPFLGVNYKLARGSFSRRGRVTFSVTFIVTTWGSIGSLHSDKWHDPVDLNIVIMTLPLTIVILSSTVYLGHLLDPDTER